MGLRAQVFVVGLLVLLLPVLAWQSVRQLHVALQEERIEAQTRRVGTMRAVLAGSPALAERLSIERSTPAPPGTVDWFAERAPWPLFVDGYADDWQELVGRETRAANLGLRVARRGERLFLFVRVTDERVVHHVPPRLDADAGENERPRPDELLVNGDALEVFVARPDGTRTHALLRVIAPGPVRVVSAADEGAAQRLSGWRAEWVDEGDGYQVEIELPLPEPGSRVGLAAIDVAQSGGPRDRWSGTMDPTAMREDDGHAGGTLRYDSIALRAPLRPWVFPGTRARLFDGRGLLIAELDALYAAAPEAEAAAAAPASPGTLAATIGTLDALLLRLFAWFAAGDLPLFPETEKRRQPLHLDAARLAAIDASTPTRRYVTVDNDRVLGTLVTLDVDSPAGERRAHLLFESNEEHASAFTGSRLARLFALLVVASLLVTLLLFAWATRLSLRVRGLSRAAAAAIDAEGRLASSGRRARLVESRARDEIGQLSRDLSALLERSSAYTRYLERLSSRLSHELGTPLSIVRSSLENIEAERLDPESRTLVARAGDGAERLAHIVRALLASTRLEQSVRHATFAPLELRAWLEEAREQYAQVHPGHRFRVVDSPGALEHPPPSPPPRPVRATVAATLLRQALDKLVENAVDFATEPDIALMLSRERPAGGGRRSGDETSPERLTLAVANVGEAPDEALAGRLFEAGRSSRAGEGAGTVHGGLGLHLVALIAEAHRGEAFAEDRPSPAGGAPSSTGTRRVIIGLRLPVRRTGEGEARRAGGD